MSTNNFNDLLAFIAVAREKSFTRAAAQLGVSQSALSHTIRGLEARLGIRLLARTTRSVSPTEAGERLLLTVAPRMDEIEAEVAALSTLRDKPAGTLRISTPEHASDTVLWPKLVKFMQKYPDIKIELNNDHALIDIVAQRYDLGVRLGDSVAKDMIAVRIAPDMRMRVVGSPVYFAQKTPPKTPADLAAHNCINLRLPTYGNLLPWEFEKNGQETVIRVNGQFISNIVNHSFNAALAGLGLAYLPDDMVQEQLTAGRLISVLEDWCPTFPGYHLYYPSRRQPSPAFALLVDALRYRPDEAS